LSSSKVTLSGHYLISIERTKIKSLEAELKKSRQEINKVKYENSELQAKLTSLEHNIFNQHITNKEQELNSVRVDLETVTNGYNQIKELYDQELEKHRQYKDQTE
jgi:hypothetical protein